MILPQEVIAKKCGGQTLSEVDIGLFVDGLISKNFNDAQVRWRWLFSCKV